LEKYHHYVPIVRDRYPLKDVEGFPLPEGICEFCFEDSMLRELREERDGGGEREGEQKEGDAITFTLTGGGGERAWVVGLRGVDEKGRSVCSVFVTRRPYFSPLLFIVKLMALHIFPSNSNSSQRQEEEEVGGRWQKLKSMFRDRAEKVSRRKRDGEMVEREEEFGLGCEIKDGIEGLKLLSSHTHHHKTLTLSPFSCSSLSYHFHPTMTHVDDLCFRYFSYIFLLFHFSFISASIGYWPIL